MASDHQTILALGASHLTVVSTTGETTGELVLEQVVHQPITGDPGLKGPWLGSIDSGLKQLAIKLSLRTVTGIVLPGWAVLTKLLKVTRIEGEGQRDVVRFEAENVLPNGLENFDWTYSVLHDDGYERDVLVQAVSTEFLNGLLEVLNRHGVKPSRIDALLSAELAAFKKQYADEREACALLDVGARSVSLVISAPSELPFIRSFNFGGGMVTQALSKFLGKSYAESERTKLEWIRDQSEGSHLEALNQSSEGFVNRLINEVQRSLALYRRQGQSGNPSRILLMGGASQLPGLSDFLERKTGIPTGFYDPFRNISSGPKLPTLQTSQVAYSLPPPLGMVLGGGDAGVPVANLLPASLSSQYQMAEKRPWWLAAAALIVLSGLVVGLKFHMEAWDLQSRVVVREAELAPLESLSQKVKEAHESNTALLAQTTAKARLIEQRQYWVTFLADIQTRLGQVEDVWLESIQPETAGSETEPGRLRVTGSLLDRENPLSLVSSNSRGRVEVLLGSFEDSPHIQSVVDRRFDTSRPGILRFNFSLVMKPESFFD